MPDVTMMPSEYFRRQCVVSVEPDETPVVHMIADFGSDQLVYSTDYPHGDSRYPRATESFLELPISDEDKRKILWDNCARFYSVHRQKGVASAMTTIKTETALDRFVSKTRALFARESDPGDSAFTALNPILAELLADPTVIAASKTWPECQFVDRRIENLLFYEDPDYKFVRQRAGQQRGAGYPSASQSRIHDHAHIYTLYGLLDGHQRIERYVRVDDGSKPDYAEIRQTGNTECGPGEIDLVRPFEIHAEEQLDERSVALIIRSEKSGGFLQGRYLPESNGYFQGYGPRQVPLAMF